MWQQFKDRPDTLFVPANNSTFLECYHTPSELAPQTKEDRSSSSDDMEITNNAAL